MGSFDTPRVRDRYREHSLIATNDLAQVHRYLDLGAQLEVCQGPVDALAADAVRELISYEPKKPVILAESGAVEPRHTGPFKLYAADQEGILLHDVLFAPFFAGAAGAGQIWHWDSYVAKNNLWRHFGRFAEVVKGLDPVAENFQPSVEERERVRVYILKGRKKTLYWLRDKENTWMSELRDGRAPAPVTGLELALAHKKALVYDPWTGGWLKGQVKNGSLALPEWKRSIVIVGE